MPATECLHPCLPAEWTKEPPAPKLKGPGGCTGAGEGAQWCGCPRVRAPAGEGACWRGCLSVRCVVGLGVGEMGAR